MQNKRFLSWNEFSNLSEKLFEKIDKNSLDRIVCVGSGGLVLGKLAADYFAKDLAVIMAKSYERGAYDSTKKIRLGDISSINPLEGRILLIDDLIENGITLAKLYSKIRRIENVDRKIKTAVLFIKPGNKFKADYYVEETKDWIVFPYEKKEFVE
jgi:hypoxanthine phosphoribosyltransferase